MPECKDITETLWRCQKHRQHKWVTKVLGKLQENSKIKGDQNTRIEVLPVVKPTAQELAKNMVGVGRGSPLNETRRRKTPTKERRATPKNRKPRYACRQKIRGSTGGTRTGRGTTLLLSSQGDGGCRGRKLKRFSPSGTIRS